MVKSYGDVRDALAGLVRQSEAMMISQEHLVTGRLGSPSSTYDLIKRAADGIVAELMSEDERERAERTERAKGYGFKLEDLRDLKRIEQSATSGKSPLYLVFPRARGADIGSLDSAICDLNKATTVHPVYVVATYNGSSESEGIRANLRSSAPQSDMMFFDFNNASLPIVLNSVNANLRREGDMARGSFFSYMDDDARIYGERPGFSQIESNVAHLRDDPRLKLISGFSVESREPRGMFHRFARLSNHPSIASFLPNKPYCHGGAGAACMRLEDYPSNGLPENGLGGISLNTLILLDIPINEMAAADHDGWYARTNREAPFSHPTRDNLIDWSCTYLGYQKAWRQAFKELPEDKAKIYRAVKQRAKGEMLTSVMRVLKRGLMSEEDVVGHLLVKEFYLPLLRSQSELSHADLSAYVQRSHTNL